jgi:hypothetical protein
MPSDHLWYAPVMAAFPAVETQKSRATLVALHCLVGWPASPEIRHRPKRTKSKTMYRGSIMAAAVTAARVRHCDRS